MAAEHTDGGLEASDLRTSLCTPRGHYRETYRNHGLVDGRAHSTAIYFLSQTGEVSVWHRIDAAEV